jgi:hypothetical protein
VRLISGGDEEWTLMAEGQIRFDDGAAYERMMGTWSRLAGAVLLDWLAPRSGLRWIDVARQRCSHRAHCRAVRAVRSPRY